MNELSVKEVNVQTGEEIVRPMTDEEISQLEKDRKDFEAKQKLLKSQAEAKAALLEKLGITEEEAKLLLG